MSKPGLIAAALLCGSLASSVHAQTTQRDVRFSKELNKLTLTDYSIYFVEQQIKKSPSDVDLLKIQLAETFMLIGKEAEVKKGAELIASVGESSPYYPFAQLTVGKIKVLKKDFKGAIQYLKAFEAYCVKEYQSENFDKAIEKDGCGYLVVAYQNSGQKALANKVKEDFLKRQGIDTTKPPQQMKLELALDKISTAEELQPGTPRTKLLDEAIKILTEEVPFFGQNEITARSYYEAGRAYVAKKQYDKAIEVMSQSAAFIAQLNKGYAEVDQSKRAPGGFISYWKGVALFEKGKLESEGEARVKLHKDAFIQFFVNLKKYEGNKFAADAYDGYRKCLAVLEENNAAPKKMPPFKIPITNTRETVLSPEETLMYTEKKFDSFINQVVAKIQTKRRASGVEDGLMKLALAYLETGNELEALAIADYMALIHPKSKETQAALTTIAVKYWKKPGKTTAENKANKEIAVREYGKFLEIAPDHPAAPDVATVVAQYYYQSADALAKSAKKVTDMKAKRAITDEAITAFKSAIPYYKYIADNFGVNERGVTALYYIARCNYYAQEYVLAAEGYLAYIPKIAADKFKLADAKFSVADNYFRAGQKYNKQYKALKTESEEMNRIGSVEYKEKAIVKMAEAKTKKEIANTNFKIAIKHLDEYTGKWLSDANRLGGDKSEKVGKITEGAYELVGWAYDLLDERKTAANKFADYINRYSKSTKIPMLMQRQGELYAELEDFSTAAKILEKLSNTYPESPQGKRALFTLARSMYNIERFSKAIATFNKILDKKLTISVSNLKWVVKNMTETDADNKSNAGKLIVRAGQELERRLEKPELSEWVGKDKAYALKGKPEETQTTIDQLRERLYFNIGLSAAEAGLSKEVFTYLGKVLANENTPFIFKAGMARADEYMKQKNWVLARQDLAKIGATAMTAQKTLVTLEVQTKTGDTFLAEENFNKAYSAFNIVAVRPITLGKEMLAMMSDQQKEDAEASRPLVEYSVYKAAICASKLGKTEEKAKLVAKYKKNFAKGRFVKEMAKLPKSVVAVAAPVENVKTK